MLLRSEAQVGQRIRHARYLTVGNVHSVPRGREVILVTLDNGGVIECDPQDLEPLMSNVFEESLADAAQASIAKKKGFDRDASNVARVFTRNGKYQHVIVAASYQTKAKCLVCNYRPGVKTKLGWLGLSNDAQKAKARTLTECKEPENK